MDFLLGFFNLMKKSIVRCFAFIRFHCSASYCASKFAQQSLGNAINLEEYENGIRCTNIAPGEVATAILDKRPVPPSNEKRAQMLAPPDIADAVVMVAKLPKVAHVTEIIMTGKTTVPEAVL